MSIAICNKCKKEFFGANIIEVQEQAEKCCTITAIVEQPKIVEKVVIKEVYNKPEEENMKIIPTPFFKKKR